MSVGLWVVAFTMAAVCFSAGMAALRHDELRGFRSSFQSNPNHGWKDSSHGDPLNGNDADGAEYNGNGAKRGLSNSRGTGAFRPGGTGFWPLNFSADPGHGAEMKAEQNTWCVARYGSDPTSLQAALDWACGPGFADCGLIQPGGACYLPNTLFAHASFAFNSYYQKNLKAPGTCDFGGTAMVIYSDPSYPGCLYANRSGQMGATVNGTARISLSSFSVSLLVIFTLWYVDFGGDETEVKRRALEIGETH